MAAINSLNCSEATHPLTNYTQLGYAYYTGLTGVQFMHRVCVWIYHRFKYNLGHADKTLLMLINVSRKTLVSSRLAYSYEEPFCGHRLGLLKLGIWRRALHHQISVALSLIRLSGSHAYPLTSLFYYLPWNLERSLHITWLVELTWVKFCLFYLAVTKCEGLFMFILLYKCELTLFIG